MSKRDETHARLEAAKRAATLQVLFRVARRADAHTLTLLDAAAGHPGLRPAHTSLLPHVDLDGTRATVIAERMGITKQAVGPLVADLVQWGLLEQVPDPADGRAKLVRFADHGAGLLPGLALLATLEADMVEHVGADRWQMFRDVLLTLDAWLDNA